MFIKICGITNIGDAQLAVSLGASALGFIFAPSKRQIDAQTARQITAALPHHVEKVGVFVDAEKSAILKTARIAGLSCLQLHGNEPPSLCARLGQHYKIIKAIKIDTAGRIHTTGDFTVWKLLLDTHIPSQAGGTGVPFPREALRSFDPGRVIVAGGLTPANILLLLEQFHPFGVDVNSGIEAVPGKKDASKMKALFDKLNSIPA